MPLIQPSPPFCPQSDFQNDVLVVLRTGATEILEKLPVHFETVLGCVPDYVIYSDMEEDIEGHHTYDVLDQVNGTLKNTVPEFELYNRLHVGGREGLEYHTVFGSGPDGALENPGWKLDKWKFLPMVDRALQRKPGAKWFVFIEADTYMVWQNMLEYLSKFDDRLPYYIGKQMQIGGVIFAHGGSGFALSNTAMKKVTDYWKGHQEEFDHYTQDQWAGDMILGKALKDVGIELFWGFPHLQGDSISTLDWNVSNIDRQPWCFAPITFHHATKSEFNMMWQFEQEWYRQHPEGDALRFRDVFKGLLYHHLQTKRANWDSISTEIKYSDESLGKLSDEERSRLSPVQQQAPSSFEKCQAACESRPACIQFSYTPGKCFTSKELRLGYAAESQCIEYSSVAGKCVDSGVKEKANDATHQEGNVVQSGWIMKRVSSYMQELDQPCDSIAGNGWVT